MKRGLIVISTAALTLLPMSPARAAYHADPDDVSGKFDINYIEANRNTGVEIEATMFGKISKKLFAKSAGNRVIVLFDADNDGSSDYRGRIVKSGKKLIVLIKGSGSQFEPLKAKLVNNDKGIRFTVPGGSPPAPNTAFGIAVKTDYNGNVDRAPDSGWLTIPAS
jgi:hypothetical protein